MAERTVYNSAKEAISNFKWGDPVVLNLSIGGSIASGSIINVAQHMLCNSQLRMPLLLNNSNLKSLGRTAQGDGDVFYGPAKSISDATYELKIMIKMDVDHPFTELYPSGTTIVGLPRSFRYRADLIQLTCTDRKILDLKWEHYDS